jgi:hypothetical protein
MPTGGATAGLVFVRGVSGQSGRAELMLSGGQRLDPGDRLDLAGKAGA